MTEEAPPPQVEHTGFEKLGADAPGKGMAIAITAAVACALGVGALGFAAFSSDGEREAPQTVPQEATARPRQDLEAARPGSVHLKVLRGGVRLAWKLPAGSPHPVMIKQAPSQKAPIPLDFGTTTTTIKGLNPATRYCFRVGALLDAAQQPPLVAWSLKPVCTRAKRAPASAVPGPTPR